jgi:RNA polymerase sigma-70 factor (ECF subfamily)
MAKFSTWLLTIARNKCVNSLKKRRPGTSERLPLPLYGGDPAEALIRRESAARFDRFLDTLPMEQRTAFVLAEIQEMSYEEIADIEGVPLGTIKSRINRAKDKLRSLLGNATEGTQ